jgi:hypothetical protein
VVVAAMAHRTWGGKGGEAGGGGQQGRGGEGRGDVG